MQSDIPSLESLSSTLLDLNQSMSKRTHAAFYLRSFWKIECIDILSKALKRKEDSTLIRHELAYILGQIRNPGACPLLIEILEDELDDILVRHECAEALGAIGHESSLETLQKYTQHTSPDISETCIIAIDLIKWRKNGEIIPKSQYQSVDPAPALQGIENIELLKTLMMDTSKSLFERYRAMFKLREINSDESALALVVGLSDSSALFRHEVAYVLGQMENSVTIEGLKVVLENQNEHRMVRHEAAEALGGIGGEYVKQLLARYHDDLEIVVKESCEVAIENMEYWEAFERNNSQNLVN